MIQSEVKNPTGAGGDSSNYTFKALVEDIIANPDIVNEAGEMGRLLTRLVAFVHAWDTAVQNGLDEVLHSIGGGILVDFAHIQAVRAALEKERE